MKTVNRATFAPPYKEISTTVPSPISDCVFKSVDYAFEKHGQEGFRLPKMESFSEERF